MGVGDLWDSGPGLLASAKEALGSLYRASLAEGRELSPERAVDRMQDAAAKAAVTLGPVT